MSSTRTRIRPVLLVLAILPLAMIRPAAADATLRKCTHVPGSSSPYYPGSAPLLMVDGVVIGDMPAAGSLSGGLSYTTANGTVTVPTDQIINLQIICLDHEVAGKKESRQVISVATRDGTEGMLRRYLGELVELQEGYRRTNGAYAAALQYVGFHLTRHPVPIELTVVDGGWSASTTFSGKSCRIAVGSAATAMGVRPAEVECIDAPQPIGSASAPSGPKTIQIRAIPPGDVGAVHPPVQLPLTMDDR